MNNKLLIITAVLLMAGCKKSNDNNNNGNNNKNNPPPSPEAAVQVSPEDNKVCYTGTIKSDTASVVSFAWAAAKYADSYTLYWTNLLTNATAHQDNITDTHADILLRRNTPYSWSVQSNSGTSKTTASSSTWKFYNSGDGIISYAPFPAVLVSPLFAAAFPSSTTAVSLQWTGSTITAGATLSYNLYFGTSNDPPIKTTGITTTSASVTVQTGKTYYWKISSTDQTGNISISQVSQFSVN